MTVEETELEASRHAACLALGIDPATVAWPAGDGAPKRSEVDPSTSAEQVDISDKEWVSIAALLPAEAPQVNSMGNRDFLNAVLTVMRRGGAWVSRQTQAAEIEAVRRRFGRWAHQGVFQRIAEGPIA